MALDFFLNIDFVNGKVVIDWKWIAGLAMEKVGFEVEGIGKGVGRVDAHDQGAVTEAGELQACGGGETRFPNASFAAEKKDAHASIVAMGSRMVRSPGARSKKA